jgi:hypothetical protein
MPAPISLCAIGASRMGGWSAAAIEGDWPRYCADSRTIIDALTNRILRENRDLYPLLEHLDRAA